MELLKTLLPIVVTGMEVYVSGQIVKKSAAHAKQIAVRSSLLIFGMISFLTLFLASILMSFVDLGNQIESHNGMHFSGMMWSAVLLTVVGIFILVFCIVTAKVLENRDLRKKALAEASENNPYGALILFGEVFLKELMVNLNRK